jgi:uncharacterized protein (TIGR02466 family)
MVMIDILFGIPIYKYRIDPKIFNKTKIIKDIEKNYKISSERNTWDKKSNLHHVYNDIENSKFKKVNFNELNKVYEDVFTNFCKNDLKLTNCTLSYAIKNYTAIRKNQYMATHQHLIDCDFSAVHYIQCPEGSSPITFLNHNDFGKYFLFLRPHIYSMIDNQDLKNSYMFAEYKYVPKEDEIIIFPSVLLHEIEKQNTLKKSRISVVINITIEKVK